MIGIYLGNRFIVKKKKLRANELEDEYEYKSDIDTKNKKDIFFNEKNIEMGIKE